MQGFYTVTQSVCIYFSEYVNNRSIPGNHREVNSTNQTQFFFKSYSLLAICCSNERCSTSVTLSATAIDNACTCGEVIGVLLSAITVQLLQPALRLPQFMRMCINN